jgi:hypothetical protein
MRDRDDELLSSRDTPMPCAVQILAGEGFWRSILNNPETNLTSTRPPNETRHKVPVSPYRVLASPKVLRLIH